MNSHRKALSFLTGAALALSGCGAPAPALVAAPDVERAAADVNDFPNAVAALQDSAYRLGAVMLAGEPGAAPDNRVTSPVSALYALAMLRAGAGTTTAAEMDEVLGFPAEHRDEAMNALLALWQEYDGDPGSVGEDEPPATPLLHLANAIFVDEERPVGGDFLATLAAQYGSGVYPVDYSDSSTKAAIDAWISEHTGGRIEEAPVEYDPDTVLSLLNTVYFAAAWAEPFDPAATSPGDFTLSGGERIQADMMRHMLPAEYAEGDGWTALDLPYNNGFVMRLVLPDDGGSPVMDAAGLADVATAMAAPRRGTVGLQLPRWEHEYKQDLKALLTAAGLEETMGPEPDFRPVREDLFVSGAAQDATITVAEKGTVAAAVTQITMDVTGVPMPDIELAFDRPFQYQILHEKTGMPLFLGTVIDPR